jgi:hypothetical protein
MTWFIGILVGLICFSIMDHLKISTLLQWIIVFLILMIII